MGWSVHWVGLVIIMATASVAAGRGGSVTYDGRSLIINGKRSILFSGSIHYPRSTPDVRIHTNVSTLNYEISFCKSKWLLSLVFIYSHSFTRLKFDKSDKHHDHVLFMICFFIMLHIWLIYSLILVNFIKRPTWYDCIFLFAVLF